jgi:mRNA-degrading endonuclease RelE of RelBE toxin-antitoxin system
MTDKQISELAAIMVNEYGHAALQVAEKRRDQYADKPHSDSYRVWARIAEATVRLLRIRRRERVAAGASGR